MSVEAERFYRISSCVVCGQPIGDTTPPKLWHLIASWMHVDRANDDHHPRLPRPLTFEEAEGQQAAHRRHEPVPSPCGDQFVLDLEVSA